MGMDFHTSHELPVEAGWHRIEVSCRSRIHQTNENQLVLESACWNAAVNDIQSRINWERILGSAAGCAEKILLPETMFVYRNADRGHLQMIGLRFYDL